jgi:hypothetical protein
MVLKKPISSHGMVKVGYTTTSDQSEFLPTRDTSPSDSSVLLVVGRIG